MSSSAPPAGSRRAPQATHLVIARDSQNGLTAIRNADPPVTLSQLETLYVYNSAQTPQPLHLRFDPSRLA